ncbi:hypothetical protein [Streptomyces sp. NPDC048295]|uniref:hypothetical protein n=1 Tax=Streptomyces sp. NPDC048295 TaxID=3154617 RepID=UPI00343B4E35
MVVIRRKPLPRAATKPIVLAPTSLCELFAALERIGSTPLDGPFALGLALTARQSWAEPRPPQQRSADEGVPDGASGTTDTKKSLLVRAVNVKA